MSAPTRKTKRRSPSKNKTKPKPRKGPYKARKANKGFKPKDKNKNLQKDSNNRSKNSKSKSVGKILNFVNIKIINKNNKKLKEGQVGEIICKTPLMFEKYYNKNKLTTNSFYKNYFKTGDYGYVKNNYLYFVGRLKNLIKVSGLSVFPEDVEKTMLSSGKYIYNT